MHQPGDTMDQHTGFPRTSTGENRPVRIQWETYGFRLRMVEAVEKIGRGTLSRIWLRHLVSVFSARRAAGWIHRQWFIRFSAVFTVWNTHKTGID